MNKKKILVVAQYNICTTVGGSITVTKNFCNMLADNNFEVTCAYYNSQGGRFLGLSDKVRLENLFELSDESFEKAANIFVEQYKPDLIVFFFPHLYLESNLQKCFDNIPRILMFHSRPDFYFAHSNIEKPLKAIYKNTTAQILFEDYYSLLPDFIKKGEVVYVPNSIKQNDLKINVQKENKKIIFLSSIDPCKGIEFLIKSFKIVVKKFPDWTLDIYGDFEPFFYNRFLEKMILKLKLTKNVFFKGITKNTLETLSQYDFCVFPSYFEGFPIGLLEAQSVGLPAIGLKKSSGVNNLIKDNYNGFLCEENHKEFAKKIEYLIENKTERAKMSEAALELAQNYEKEKVDKIWLDLIENIINHKKLPTIKKDKAQDLFPVKRIINMTKVRLPFYYKIYSKFYDYKRQKKVLYIMGIKISKKMQKEK